MQALQWAFERISAGLASGNVCDEMEPPRVGDEDPSMLAESATTALPPKWIAKESCNNQIFDAKGRALSEQEAAAVSVWRSHHSFSARCGLVQPPEKLISRSTTPVLMDANNKNILPTYEGHGAHTTAATSPSSTWLCPDADAYRSWSAEFRMFSINPDPHVLISVAPRYLPYNAALKPVMHADVKAADENTDDVKMMMHPFTPTAAEEAAYDRSMLDTPLIWEQPYVLSIDCGKDGASVWSDHWEMYGQRVAERCYVSSGYVVPSLSETLTNASMGGVPSCASLTESMKLGDRELHKGFLRLQWSVGSTTHENEEEEKVAAINFYDGREPMQDVVLVSGAGEPCASRAPRAHLTVSVCSDVCTTYESEAQRVAAESPPPVDDMESFLAATHVQPRKHVPCARTAITDTCVWKKVAELHLPMDAVARRAVFAPYVTLLDGGEEVHIH